MSLPWWLAIIFATILVVCGTLVGAKWHREVGDAQRSLLDKIIRVAKDLSGKIKKNNLDDADTTDASEE